MPIWPMNPFRWDSMDSNTRNGDNVTNRPTSLVILGIFGCKNVRGGLGNESSRGVLLMKLTETPLHWQVQRTVAYAWFFLRLKTVYSFAKEKLSTCCFLEEITCLFIFLTTLPKSVSFLFLLLFVWFFISTWVRELVSPGLLSGKARTNMIKHSGQKS